MNKKRNLTLFILLILFSTFCAISIGETWDEKYELLRGKVSLDYFFSLGKINTHILYREYNSPIYYTFLYFVTTIFPSIYQIEVSHMVNSFFSICTILGIRKTSKELFNQKVGDIAFLILFFYPVFFGHMAFNSKDTILAFSHVWIFYLILRYLKYQNNKVKTNNYIFFIGLLAATATGIKFVFLGSLLPIILFLFLEIFYFKKIVCKKFILKKIFFDLIKCFFIFYIFLILFWIDVYPNIIQLPYDYINDTFSNINKLGWYYNLINGTYYISFEVPNTYLLINLLYKSPEYILLSYFLFIVIILTSGNFFKNEFKFFYYKLGLVLFILLFVNFVLLIIPYPIYDGMRLFLWVLPYFCIVPALTIYYFLENINSIKSKISLFILSLFFIYFLFNFFIITPYQYTYLNILNGKKEFRYKKFENDYWGGSIKELIKKSNFRKDKKITFSTCGVEIDIIKKYLKKAGYKKISFLSDDKADYIIMTNRTIEWNQKLTNCFEKYSGENVYKVERNGLILSVIRKNIFKN